jgi:hypothetical protein
VRQLQQLIWYGEVRITSKWKNKSNKKDFKMTTTFSQTVFSPWLTPVRLASVSNIAGTYYNGPSNNGVGATLTVAASSLTVDSVVAQVGDRILLQTQTNTYEQGIYVVRSIGTTVVLERSDDQQNIEQLKAGEYVAVGAGSIQAGTFFTLIEPLPQVIGVDAISFSTAPSGGTGVTFSGGAATANALAVFSNSAGDIKAASTTTTLGQALAVTGSITASTSITATGGDIQSGSSGDAGTFISYPATAANGTFIFQATNAGGAFNTTIASGTMGQSTVYTVPDIGASTGGVVVSTTAVRMKAVAGAAAAGGAAAQSFTDAFCTSGSCVVGNWNTQANAASVLKIVPGNGSFVVTSSADAGVGTFNYIITK